MRMMQKKSWSLLFSKWVKAYVHEGFYAIGITLLSDSDTKFSIVAVTFVGYAWVNRYSLFWIIKIKEKKADHMSPITLSSPKFSHL